MTNDDTTLGDDIRAIRFDCSVERVYLALADRADALTAALREAREERDRLDGIAREWFENRKTWVEAHDRLAAQVEAVRALADRLDLRVQHYLTDDQEYDAEYLAGLNAMIRAALDTGKEE